MTPLQGDPSTTPPRSHDRTRSGLGSRRVVAVSFGISVLLHVWLIALYPVVAPGPREDYELPGDSVVPDGLDIIRLMEALSSLDPERPQDPDEVQSIDDPAVVTDPVTIGIDQPAGLEPPPMSGAERIRPRMTVPELWRPTDPSITSLSFEQREQLILSARIAEFYDSLAAALEEEAALTDWTYTDSEGKRWGVADGKIYLGDTVLPGQHFFGVPVGRRDEYAREVWIWQELQRQGARAEVVETWKERQAAIRERRDRERAARDTTRGGR